MSASGGSSDSTTTMPAAGSVRGLPHSAEQPPTSGLAEARAALAPALVVCLLLALFATLRTPIPAVNEPHYLTKARHFWEPGWCGRDLFLQSANAHAVYLAAMGGLTRWLSFEQTAWVGRVLVWGLLAWGFTRLSQALVPQRWAPVWVVCGFLALQGVGNLSGEWVVGGVEAKGFAYAALFGALSLVARARWWPAGLCLGAAVSLHPVVGVWGAAAVACGLLTMHAGSGRDADGTHRLRVRHLLSLANGTLLTALPGLIPAVLMLLQNASPEVARQADQIQVYGRLAHHLNPARFSVTSWAGYGLLALGWVVLVLTRPAAGRTREMRLLDGVVLGAGLIAAGGLVAGFGLQSAGLLKFYPFRLIDALLPLAVVMNIVQRAALWTAGRGSHARDWQRGAIPAVCLLGYVATLGLQPPDRNPSGLSEQNHRNWLDVCAWVQQHTPEDALFLTPRFNFGFKWSAQRAEYAVWKDCPQDAGSLVEWKRRLDLVHRWRIAHFQTGFDATAVEELRQATGIDYIVAWRQREADPYLLPVEYRNGSFVVIRVPRGAEPAP